MWKWKQILLLWSETMMKLEKTKMLAAMVAMILVSSVASAKGAYDSSSPGSAANLDSIGSSGGRAVLGGSAAPDSIEAMLAPLIEQGAQVEFDADFNELDEKQANWKERTKTLKQVDEKLGALKAKQQKDKKKGLEADSVALNSTLGKSGAGINSSLFTTPANATKSCTKDVNVGTVLQDGQNFSGVLKRVNGSFQKLLAAETEKAKKAAKAEFAAALADADKKLKEQEAPGAEELSKEELASLSDLDREKMLKKKEADVQVAKQSFSRAALDIFKKHGERLSEAKANKALFGEITNQLGADLEVARAQFEKGAVRSAQMAYRNCQDVSEQAGIFGEGNQQGQNGAFGQFASMMPQMGGQSFPPGSSAQRAMEMLTANYRGSLNFVPVVTMYGQLFGNMLNDAECTDMSPQVAQITGQNLKNSFSGLASAQDAKTLNRELKKVDQAITTAVNEVGKLFGGETEDSGMLAACQNFADMKKQFDQFAQGQAGQVMGKGQGGQQRSPGPIPGAHGQTL